MGWMKELIDTHFNKDREEKMVRLNFQETLKNCSSESAVSYFKNLKDKIKATFDS